MQLSNAKFDLLSAAVELSKHKKYKDISQKIRQHSSLLSALVDLNRANELLIFANEMVLEHAPPTDKGIYQDSRHAHIVGALVFRAIILYTSATHTTSHSSTGRFNVGLRGAPLDIRKAHERLCGLRDSALAHYGTGGHHSPTPWIKDALILHLEVRSLRIDLDWSRQNYTTQSVSDFNQCLSFVHGVIKNRIETEGQALEKNLSKNLEDPLFFSILSKYWHNESEFFVGLKEGEAVKTTLKAGAFFVDDT